MVARLFICGALIVLGAGFLWFAGNVIYLGVKEFFKQKKEPYVPEPAPAMPAATAASTASSTVPTAATPAP